MGWWIVILIVVIIGAVIAAANKKQQARERSQRAQTYAAQVDVEKTALLTGPGSAFIPALSAEELGYRPVGGEKCLAVQPDVFKMEWKSTGRYSTRGQSISIPIAKGVRYRVGSGSVSSSKTWQATSRGRLIVTDKAMVFEGDQKNERVTWSQIANIEIHADGFSIARRTGPLRSYRTDNPSPRFTAIVELMLERT